jgi:dipeptidase D
MDSNSVLQIFQEITKIPRESGHEEKMTNFLMDFASAHHLACKRDKIGNVLITKEASKGKEKVPTIVLQGHQDMVCDKVAQYSHDFTKDPVKYEIENGWMIAKNTTLGADDGIGDAASLALLVSDLPMGKIEALFTISEETGMDGAHALESGFFTGKTLINLDSEDEGQLFVGCAGGLDTIATFNYRTEDFKAGYKSVRLRIFNAIGGHSGDDINKERVNTLQMLSRFLFGELSHPYQLIMIKGGNKPNAIARESEAIIAVEDGEMDKVIDRFHDFGEDVKAEYSVSDPDVRYEAEAFRCTEKPVEEEIKVKLVSSLFAAPHGVQAMSQDIPGLVETSTNLASVRMNEAGSIVIVTSQRSSIASARRAVASKVEALFSLAGATVEHVQEYPGWKPNMDSHILKVCVESYKRLFGTPAQVKAIHAGLECGLFLTKFPDLDMISFGPTLRGVHAPGEKLELASMDKFVALLVDVVTNFE